MKIFFIFFFFHFSIFYIFSQEIPVNENQEETLNWDISTIFDEPIEQAPEETATSSESSQTGVINQVRRNSLTFTYDARFSVGAAPGWYNYPWDGDIFTEEGYYLERYIRLRNTFTIDAQISKELRVLTSMNFNIPPGTAQTGTNPIRFELGNFYFDYNLLDIIYFRGGKFNLRWGISPNYRFTNLLSRIPSDNYERDSFIFRIDYPIGVGGIQLLTLTRADLMESTSPELKLHDFGFGAKYNLALKQADFDLGVFYQEGMPFRSFLSIKTTLWTIEFFNEYLLAINDNGNDVSGALNFGAGRDFFDNKLTLGIELLYNAEKGTEYFQEETTFQDPTNLEFIDGFNMAFNILYRPFEKGNPRVFVRLLYNPEQESAQVTPGIRYSPFKHLEFYLATPMSLGREDGYYRQPQNTFSYDPDGDRPLPFAVVFMVTLNGQARVRHNL